MVHAINAQRAQELIDSGDVDVVDVREPNEFSGGHLPGARLVPLDTLRAAQKGAFAREHVLFVCAAGVRSQTAARLVANLGLTNVYSLTGGVRGWAKAGLPIVTERLSA